MARIRGSHEELRSKGGVIGWYRCAEGCITFVKSDRHSLISAMRAHDVQPIVIWDKGGTRPWKAAEVCDPRLTAASLIYNSRLESDYQ